MSSLRASISDARVVMDREADNLRMSLRLVAMHGLHWMQAATARVFATAMVWVMGPDTREEDKQETDTAVN